MHPIFKPAVNHLRKPHVNPTTSSSTMSAVVSSSTALCVISLAATIGKFINYYFLICVCIICVKVLFLICLCLSYRLQINCSFILKKFLTLIPRPQQSAQPSAGKFMI
nr:uncharacterized protein LOC124807181 [Hydra vulgaris]